MEKRDEEQKKAWTKAFIEKIQKNPERIRLLRPVPSGDKTLFIFPLSYDEEAALDEAVRKLDSFINIALDALSGPSEIRAQYYLDMIDVMLGQMDIIKKLMKSETEEKAA